MVSGTVKVCFKMVSVCHCNEFVCFVLFFQKNVQNVNIQGLISCRFKLDLQMNQ